MKYSHIAARVFETPLLVSCTKLRTVLSVLGPRMGFDVGGGPLTLEAPAREVPEYDDEDDQELVCADRCGYRIDNGVARIPVFGTLMHRCSAMAAESGMTSYLGLSDAFSRAMADPGAHAILIEIDSPGGEANGCFDFADEVFAARGDKPIWAIAVDWADSGAYMIASAADHIVVTQSGEVGSIGVVWSHCDFSAQDKMIGLAVTYLYAGDRKIDGNPDQPLSDPARARFQSEIEKTYSLFVNLVARNRGLSVDEIRATQALTYIGADGIAVGLADEVGTLRNTLQTLAAMAPRSAITDGAGPPSAISYAPEEEVIMTEKTKAPVAVESTAQPTQVFAPAAIPPAQVMEMELDRTAVVHAATVAATSAERSRVGSIIDSDEADGREDLAKHLAFSTDMTAEAARAVLAKAPKAQPPAPPAAAATVTRFDAAMEAAGNPKVGHEPPSGDDEANVTAFVEKTMQIFNGNKRSA